MSEKPAPAAKAATTRPEDEVSIYNRSPKFGDYVHDVFEDVKDSSGRVTGRKKVHTYRAEAGAFCKLPRWLADLWMRMAPAIIVSADSVGAPSDHKPTTAEVVALRNKNSELEKRLDGMQKLIEELQNGGPR